MGEIDLSIIVPCYNDSSVLEENLAIITDILTRTRYNYEIILIDDKSSDNTAELIKKIIGKGNPRIRAFFHEKNRGRGGSVSEGVMLSKGRIAGYIDIDLEVPPENIITHAIAIDSGYDVAYACRITKLEIWNAHRHMLHIAYMILAKLILGIGFEDINAGCKFFNRKKITPVLKKVKDSHWFWDSEILTRSYMEGLKMKAVPALYITNKKRKSTVKIFSDSLYFIKRLFEFSQEISAERKQQNKNMSLAQKTPHPKGQDTS